MSLSYNLAYQELILVHPTRRQIFAGKPYSTFWNIWDLLVYRRKKLCQWSVDDLLYDCDAKLDVGEVVKHVEPADDADDRQDESHSDEYRDASENCKTPLRHTLVASLEDEALENCFWWHVLFVFLVSSGLKPERWW